MSIHCICTYVYLCIIYVHIRTYTRTVFIYVRTYLSIHKYLYVRAYICRLELLETEEAEQVCLLVYAQNRTIARAAGEFLCSYYFTDELIEAAKKMTVPKGVHTCMIRCILYIHTCTLNVHTIYLNHVCTCVL